MTLDEAKLAIETLQWNYEPYRGKPVLQPDGSIDARKQWAEWFPGDYKATLDGEFTADQLEAIAVLMRIAP